MNKALFTASALFLFTAWLASRAFEVRAIGDSFSKTGSSKTGEIPESGEIVGPRIVESAQGLLKNLDDAQRGKATFDFNDGERFNWHFIPRSRKGLAFKAMNDSQKKKMKALLSASLSRAGAEKAEQVRELEAILGKIEGPDRRFSRDPDLYYLSVFGQPGKEGRWGWRFEGHHLALNFTLDGDRLISATPIMYGANPAIVREGPRKGLRVLGDMEDVARELVTSLDEDQKKVALGEKYEEIQTTRSPTYNTVLPQGISFERLNRDQRKLLRKLVVLYTRNLQEETWKEIHQAIRDNDSGKVQFVWRGGTKAYEGHSYMVHGPTFVISYANFQDDAAHIHAALRHTKGEFGLAEKKVKRASL